jgi:hypothetical protein
MLYKWHNNIFIIGLLTISLVGVWTHQFSFDLMAIGTVVAFVSQMALLMYFVRDENVRYAETTLLVTVLTYSILLGIVFMSLSEYFEGDTFMLTKKDAMLYYKGSMRANDVGFIENAKYLMNKKAFDDWGAYLYDSFLMSIIPSKFFLNASYMLTGAISSMLLFRIGRYYMPEAYAFVGAMAYGTSSYLIMFHCTFLKESLFVFLVICTIYHLNRGIHQESSNAYPFAVFFLFLLFFFRPAVAAFIIMSFAVYVAVKQHGSALSFFFYLAVVVGFVISIRYMMDMADRYSSSYEEKSELSGNAKAYSGGFNVFVNLFGGFFGPFPTLFTKHETGPSTIQFYGAGLTYRLFMIFPFLGGLYFILKNRVLELIPITVFILAEMLATGMIAASLELRKVMPHIPLTYIVSFYGLSKWQESKVFQRIPNALVFGAAIGIILLWNVIKTK